MQKEILDVKLVTENELGTLVEPHFIVTHPEEHTSFVPVDVSNRDYILVKEWYDAQEVKPFNFQFPESEPYEFAETIYPPKIIDATEPTDPALKDPVEYTFEDVTEADIVRE